MSRHHFRLALLGFIVLFLGCATTRQPVQPRQPAPPMIGQRAAPKAKEPEVVVRATAPVSPAKPQAAGAPVKPVSLERPPTETPVPDQLPKLRELYAHAAERYSGIQDYICRFRRREFVNGKQEPEDLLEFKYRKPDSIYMKWIGGQLVGRELIFVKGKYKDELQIRTGKGDLIAGFRTTLDPHSARATANSRRTVDEAGIGNLIDGFGAVLAAQEKGATNLGTLRYVGPTPRQESALPMDCVEQTIPPGLEKHLPRGGVRYFFFNRDDRTRDYELPVLVITQDPNRREVEYYCFDRVNTNVGLKSEEFDPDVIWKRK